MVSFLSFCTGLLLGFLVAAAILVWCMCQVWQYHIMELEDDTEEVKTVLKELEDALKDGTISINVNSKD